MTNHRHRALVRLCAKRKKASALRVFKREQAARAYANGLISVEAYQRVLRGLE